MALVAVLVSTTLVSCGGSDDDNNGSGDSGSGQSGYTITVVSNDGSTTSTENFYSLTGKSTYSSPTSSEGAMYFSIMMGTSSSDLIPTKELSLREYFITFESLNVGDEFEPAVRNYHSTSNVLPSEMKYISGKVKVIAKTASTLTIQFINLEFRNSSSTMTYLVNGTAELVNSVSSSN